jgi:hypothetical protein
LDGTVLGTVTVPNTGGWQVFQTVTLPSISIPDITTGQLSVVFDNGGVNFNYLESNLSKLPGDLNLDRKIDLSDVALMSAKWLDGYDVNALENMISNWLK